MNGNEDWLKFLLQSGVGPEILRSGLGAGTMPMQRPSQGYTPQPIQEAQLQPGGGGTGGGGNWLKTLLSIGLPMLAGGMMGHEARGIKAPHGGTVGSKPIMAQGLRAFATSIEQRAKAEQLIKEAEQKRQDKLKADQEQKRQFDLTYQLNKEIADFNREWKMAELERKYQPETMTPEEMEIHKLTLKEKNARIANIYANTAAANALAAKRLKETGTIVDFNDVNKLFKDATDLKTPAGLVAYGNISAAWNEYLNTGNISPLEQVRDMLNPNAMKTYSETTQEVTPEGEPLGYSTQRIKPADDYTKLDKLINGLINSAGNIQTNQQQPTETIEDARKAYTAGNYDEAAEILNRIGKTAADL